MNALRPLLRSLAACFVLSVAVGCAAPATVEGVFGGETFRLDSEDPLSKPFGSGRDIVVVLSQMDAETLRTVTVKIPGYVALLEGEAVAVGLEDGLEDGMPSLEVAVGDLLVEGRADGARIISSTDAQVALATGGTLTLDSVGEGTLAGTFDVDLDDGGYVSGTFVVAAP